MAGAFRVVTRNRVADLLRDALESGGRVFAIRWARRAQGAKADEFGQRLRVQEVAAAARTEIGQ
jgi:hypothetical protein